MSHPRPKCIIVNGPAGIGKSTMTRRYLKDNPLSLGIDGDELIVMLGQWLQHEDRAREMTFELIKSMASTHLHTGHDVVVPYLLLNAQHAEELAAIARACDATFVEVALTAERSEAIDRLLARGTWGEKDAPPLTTADRPIIEDLYDRMVATLKQRPATRIIPVAFGDVETTYKMFLAAVNAA